MVKYRGITAFTASVMRYEVDSLNGVLIETPPKTAPPFDERGYHTTCSKAVNDIGLSHTTKAIHC